MTDFKLLQQALDALEFPHDSEWSNKAKAIEALQHALAQPEFDTPESHIVKWSIPVDPNNFGEPLAQPEQDQLAHDQVTHGMTVTLGGERIDPASIYKKPEQEPVAWRNAAIRLGEDLYSVGPDGYYDMTAKQWLDWALSVVNTTPPRKPWVGLTDDEVAQIEKTVLTRKQALRMIEQLLKDKNT
jgi:hypothetical protein